MVTTDSTTVPAPLQADATAVHDNATPNNVASDSGPADSGQTDQSDQDGATPVVKSSITDETSKVKTEEPPVVDTQAWKNYQTVRGFLPLALAGRVAKALGRPLGTEDINLLVQPDGGEQVCDACGQKFMPTKFASITGRFLELVADSKSIRPEDIRYQGAALVVGENVIRFCGPFWAFNKAATNSAGEEWFGPQKRSCLGSGYLHKENEDPSSHRQRPSRSIADAEALVTRFRQERESRQQARRNQREAHINQVGDAFARVTKPHNPNGGGGRDWSPSGDRQGQKPRGNGQGK